MRARIVLAVADGEGPAAISARLGVSRPTVTQWGDRFLASGLEGLNDAPRSGRPKTVDDAAILAATLEPPPRSCRCVPGCRRRPPTTTSATAPRPCSPRSRSLPARSPSAATTGTARPSSAISSRRSPGTTRVGGCTSWLTTTTPTSTPTSARGLRRTRGSRCYSPDLGFLAEPGRSLLRDHHPSSHPPRILRQRQGTRRRDQPLHRRLERTLPPLHLDQDR
jgi:hypothetical protein